MRALITGGAGFIGSHLAKELLEKGDVCVVDEVGSMAVTPALGVTCASAEA